jgi:hypothetical protein
MDSVRHVARSYRWMAAAGALLAAFTVGVAGCWSGARPTEVMVSQVSTEVHPAKPPDCNMPILTAEPTVAYKQVAIVEAWADITKKGKDVLPELKRKACATGAQALLILNAKSQDVKSLLYGATPNSTETEVTAANNTPNQAGQYIQMMEHTRRIGEPGHSGFYIDAVAIDYEPSAKTAASNGQPSSP